MSASAIRNNDSETRRGTLLILELASQVSW